LAPELSPTTSHPSSIAEFAVGVWNYCTYDEHLITKFAFDIFDVDHMGKLDLVRRARRAEDAAVTAAVRRWRCRSGGVAMGCAAVALVAVVARARLL